jgi:H+-transporting ATPase
MTGDGVNDAPALKRADIGIAVSNSADVAKAAASMVIVEPGTKVIIEAVKTSRQIYQRMLTWTLNKITKSIQFLALLTVGFVWFHDVIISISGLMLIVFVNDFMTLSLATDNAESTNNPNKWNVRNITIASVILGAMFFIEGLIVLWVGVNQFNLPLDGIRTMVLLTFAYTSQFRVLLVRERRHFWESVPSRDVMLTVSATIVGFTLLAVFGIILAPILAIHVLFTLALAALCTLAMDVPKCYIFRKLGI